MSELSREALLGIVREVWEQRDPVPDHLVAAMQATAALAATDLDVELMELVERSTELAGARGSSAYTLRFVHGDTDLLLRVAVDGDRSRVDGWVVPAEAMTVRALAGSRLHDAVVSESGRFELTDLPVGLMRLRLEPHDHSPPGLRNPYLRDLSLRSPMHPARRQQPDPQALDATQCRRGGFIGAVGGRVARPRHGDSDQRSDSSPHRLRRPAAGHLEVGGRRPRGRGPARGRRAVGVDRHARAGGPPYVRLRFGLRTVTDRGRVRPGDHCPRRLDPAAADPVAVRGEVGRGVGLDHVVFSGRDRGQPVHARQPLPARATRSTPGTPPDATSPPRSPSYAEPGSGGRQPVAYVGPPPGVSESVCHADPSWRSSTLDVAATPGSTRWWTGVRSTARSATGSAQRLRG